MSTTLIALAVVSVGYILAYVVFDRLRDTFGYVGGAEYLIIGVLLGPHVTGLLREDVIRDLTPIISLALGWMGMLLGSYFRLPTMALIPSAHVSMAFAEAAATFGIALSATLSVFHWIVGLAWPQAAIPAVTLAAIATLSAPAAIDAFARKGLGPSRLFPVLQLTARVDALIGVTAFGLVLAILHQGDVARSVRPPTATEWAVINIAIGVASGVLFHLFLGPREEAGSDDDRARLFVALAGTIVIASGASYYLNLSPIFTSMVLGFILANTGKAHRDVSRLLETTERPVYLMLLIFAGAAWSPGSPTLLFVVPAFIAVRLVAKLAGGWVGGRVAASQELDTPNMGSALLALGGLGVAIAVNYSQVHPDLAANAVLTATLVAVLLFETVASTGTLAILKESMPPDVEDSPARSVWEISGGLPPPTPAPPPPPDVPPSPESPAP
jgi:Kef-type K+ transport system membrane component KefB